MKHYLLILLALFGLVNCGGSADTSEEDPSSNVQFGELLDLGVGHETLWEGRQTCDYYTIRLRPETSNYAYLNDAVVEAADAWDKAMGYDFVHVRTGEEPNPFIDDPTSAVLVTTGQAPQFGPQDSGAILLELATIQKDYGPCACQVEVWDEAWDKKIIAHAMGHCFGLSHSDLEDSLMFRRAKGGEFTEEMVQLLFDNMDTQEVQE